MATIKVETKNQIDIGKKPRVYFACHPDDFKRYFQKICQDIFKTHDCAIYYTENMAEAIAPEDRETDLGRNNLFVIPVTFKLLTTPNRAMDEDFPYACKEHIPVLPVMMESGLDTLYAAADKFGELQYLNPYSTDPTEISYEEKLKKHLESVLLSDEMAKRVREAFAAYIFLSYRKKDRKYANELMRLIHNIPEFRDVAIWFDEFLTPGESFKEGINKILSDSKLFALLVTPNLLEEVDGKPNFVMAEEYPAAVQAGMAIVPAEMESTEKETLSQKYKDIPRCVDPRNGQELKCRLTEVLFETAKTKTEDPVHHFLIGLAYMEGIDMEINRKRGLQLITMAAEAEVPEAMRVLYQMYDSGKGIAINYREAEKWATRLVRFYEKQYGADHPTTIEVMRDLVGIHFSLGQYDLALEENEQLYGVSCGVYGENHPSTLVLLCNKVPIYCETGNYARALAECERVYALSCAHLGQEHPITIVVMRSMAMTQIKLGKYPEAVELSKKVLDACRKLTNDTSVETLLAKSNLASAYTYLEDHKEAGRILEEIYPLCEQVLGAAHPMTITVLNNLGTNYSMRGNGEKALEIATKVLARYKRLYGDTHPTTLLALSNSAQAFEDVKEHETARTLQSAAYDLRCEVLGEEHPDAILSLARLAGVYASLKDYKKALATGEKAYGLFCKVLGDFHVETIRAGDDLAYFHAQYGDYRRSLELLEKNWTAYCALYGKAHKKTLRVAHSLVQKYHNLKEDDKALALITDAYQAVCQTLGPTHPLTRGPLEDLTFLLVEMENVPKAMELWQQAYDVRLKELGQEHPELQWIQEKMNTQKRWAALKQSRKVENCCQYCGSSFKGVFKKKCKTCGRLKDY